MTYDEAMAYVAEKCPNALGAAYAKDGAGIVEQPRQRSQAGLVLAVINDWRGCDTEVRVFLQDLASGRV